MSLLTPKKWKYRKQQRGRNKGKSMKGNYVSFGEFGLKSLDNVYVTNRQLEAARKVIIRYVRKVGKLWIRIFPDLPYTKKGLEMPMGKGKGEVDIYRAKVKRGRILFEVVGVDKKVATEAFKQAAYKLPLKAITVEKDELR